MNVLPFLRTTAVAITLSALGGLGLAPAQANPLGNQIPQIPAFLPKSTDVPMTQPLPIDGEWTISSIGKRIRIEAGRAYAVDPWVHLFVLQIQPTMVVLKDIKRTGVGQYTANDLPLAGVFNASMQSDGSLDVTVTGSLVPVKYKLIPVQIDDREAFNLERSGEMPALEPFSSDSGDNPGQGDTQPIEEWTEQDSWENEDWITPPNEPINGEPQENPDAGEEKVTPW